MTEPIPVDLDGTPLDKVAKPSTSWSRNNINALLRWAYQRDNPKPYVEPPPPPPPHPDVTALHDAFVRQYVIHPWVWTTAATAVGVHLFGLHHLDPNATPTQPEPTPFTPRTPNGWDARRWHDTTARTVTVIDPHNVIYADRWLAAIRILETLRDALGVQIPGWPDVTGDRP